MSVDPRGPGGALLHVLAKDLLIEWRVRTRALALVCFAFTLLLLFSFAIGPNTALLQKLASAYLWMTLMLSSSLLLSASFQIEVEAGALERMLLVPVSPSALFYGKALANTAQLFGLGLTATVMGVVLFDAHPSSWGAMVAVLALGAAGVAAPGTMYAGLTARIPARQLLLPLLLFPLLVPALLAAVKATGLLMQGDPMHQLSGWMTLLGCFDLLFWSLCGLLFGKVVGP